MIIAKEVKARIEEMEEGRIISYQDFQDFDNQGAVALALSRLCKEEKIRRLQKGKYYKPKKTKFGELEPGDARIVSGVLGEEGYVTGLTAYNRLGLTTQVPNEITIKGRKYPRKASVGKLKIRFIRDQNQTITTGSEELLTILDAFKNIKRIPDSDVTEVFKKLSKIVENLDEDQQRRLAKLALKYKPSVRALLGAVLEKVDEGLVRNLKKSLNPLSVYKIGLSMSVSDKLNTWRIQ